MKLVREYLLGPALIWAGIIVFCLVLYYFGFILDYAFHVLVAAIIIVPATLWVVAKVRRRNRS